MAGERQPAAVHAAVCALNTSLGNTGKTVSYYETKDASLPSVNSLVVARLRDEGGAVQTLVVLGGNPVFDAPADLDFAAAMAKVPHSIALGHTVDETSAKAEWHIPRAHYLESWGDARAVGGTLSVVQPLILPLFGGRTPVEVLGLMVGGEDRPGYDIVRETWNPILGEARVRQEVEPRPARWVPRRQRASRSRSRSHGGALGGTRAPGRSRRHGAGRPDRRVVWRSCSSPPRRFTTADSRTTGGCRSFPIP